MEEKVAADVQYAVGAFVAIASLLAVIANHQGLDLRGDLTKLSERAGIFNPELEAHKLNGYSDTVAVFRDVFTR